MPRVPSAQPLYVSAVRPPAPRVSPPPQQVPPPPEFAPPLPKPLHWLLDGRIASAEEHLRRRGIRIDGFVEEEYHRIHWDDIKRTGITYVDLLVKDMVTSANQASFTESIAKKANELALKRLERERKEMANRPPAPPPRVSSLL